VLAIPCCIGHAARSCDRIALDGPCASALADGINKMSKIEFDPFMTQIGENVDQLVTLDVMCYGVIGPLYRGARAVQGDAPLCLQAAARLRERLANGGTTVITTGLILPGHYPYGETDGPIGTAVLARALALGLSSRVLVVTEPELTGLVAALLRTIGLQVIGPDAFASEDGRHRPVACVLPLSLDENTAAVEAKVYFDRFDVRALIAIEKAGANAKGVYHMVGGTDLTPTVSKARALFDEASRRKILTIGIGDRGNELGLGPIAATTRALLPFGQDCGCPCHGGVADETPSDLAVPAVISNWGAYGIAACLAVLLDDVDLIQRPEIERALFDTALREGGVDGMSGRAITAADGVGVEENVAVVNLLREIYRAQSARNPSPFSTPIIRRERNLAPSPSVLHRHI